MDLFEIALNKLESLFDSRFQFIMIPDFNFSYLSKKNFSYLNDFQFLRGCVITIIKK